MMGFFDIIQAYFMHATGRFVLFSGRDVALLEAWRKQGATPASICRGIREAVLALDGADPPRSVYNCRKFIAPHIAKARERVAGGAGAHGPGLSLAQGTSAAPKTAASTMVQRALGALESAGARCEDEALRELYRSVWYTVRELDMEPDIDRQVEGLLAVEERLGRGYWERLDPDVQRAIDARIRSEAARLDVRMSAHAWSHHVVARRRFLMVHQHGLVALLP